MLNRRRVPRNPTFDRLAVFRAQLAEGMGRARARNNEVKLKKSGVRRYQKKLHPTADAERLNEYPSPLAIAELASIARNGPTKARLAAADAILELANYDVELETDG